MIIDNRTAPYAITLIRITLGLLFAAHVYLKICVFGFAGTANYFSSLGLPAVFAYFAIILETVGAVSLIFGIYARWLALILVGQLLGTIIFEHGAHGFFFTNEGGGWEYPAFWAVILFAQFLLGDGKAALLPSPYFNCSK